MFRRRRFRYQEQPSGSGLGTAPLPGAFEELRDESAIGGRIPVRRAGDSLANDPVAANQVGRGDAASLVVGLDLSRSFAEDLERESLAGNEIAHALFEARVVSGDRDNLESLGSEVAVQ